MNRTSRFIFLMTILTAALLLSSGLHLFFLGDPSGTAIYFLMGITLFLGCVEFYLGSHRDGTP